MLDQMIKATIWFSTSKKGEGFLNSTLITYSTLPVFQNFNNTYILEWSLSHTQYVASFRR